MTQSSEKGRHNFIDSFSGLLRLPRAFWIVIAAFVIDSSAYFGMLTLMTIYLSTDLHWGDERAGVTVSVFTMLVTLFMLLPVRTLFAHQWLTMPQYILRAYDKPVADKMEWLVNWINPAIIFIGVPVATALTRHINVYTMMIIGALVSAVPTFLLCAGPSLPLLITYFVVFSIGDALWSARFLEYASELAPPGRIAQYMGLANIPWLLAKGTTGFYSGVMLAKYVPENAAPTQIHSGTLWFFYGCIAMLSPIGLWLAPKWVMKGMHPNRVS